MQQIPIEQVDARIRAENPWWDDSSGVISSVAKMTPRPYLDLFMPLVSDRAVRRALVLMGPRRVGKTVMLHHAIQILLNEGTNPKHICYVSVDHPLLNGLGLEELMAAYERATGVDIRQTECYFFFDEIQYLRDWEIHLKSIVDSYEHVKCIASGSAAAALKLKSDESGAGRFTDFLLPPLTFHEYLTLLGVAELVPIELLELRSATETIDIDELNRHFVNYLNFGGYPEVALSPSIQEDPARFVKSDVIDKVLLRDLPSLYGIQDVQELNHLFTTLAFNTANEVSLDQLAQGSGVSKSTIKRYIEYLEAAFLLRVVHRVDRNAKRFKRANFFKVYLTNPSMKAALFSPASSRDESMGALVETAIFSQWFHSDYDLHYARWSSGEVDIVRIDPDQKVRWAIEVKWSDRFFDRPHELESLVKFCHAQNLSDAYITTRTKAGDKQYKSVTLSFTPAAFYCCLLGYEAVANKRDGMLEGK